MAKKKKKSKLKNFFSKMGKGLKAVAGTLNPVILPILPFLPMMKKVLQKKGVKNIPKNPTKLVLLFSKEIMHKGKYDYMSVDEHFENFVAAIAGVVTGVLTFVKDLIKKKKKGEKLSPVEASIASGAEGVEKIAKEQAVEEAQTQTGKAVFKVAGVSLKIVPVIIISVVVIAVLYFLFGRKSK